MFGGISLMRHRFPRIGLQKQAGQALGCGRHHVGVNTVVKETDIMTMFHTRATGSIKKHLANTASQKKRDHDASSFDAPSMAMTTGIEHMTSYWTVRRQLRSFSISQPPST